MKRIVSIASVLASLVFFSATCHACLNDRDTLAEEIQGLPDVVQIITGRFERNPPLFYQMRIQREISELRSHPALLGDYDDVGVAYDRLGQDDEAIHWLSLKRTHLPPYSPDDPALKEQWYRYYANIGTCRVHRWIRAGADRAKISEVQQARDEIAEAVAIKPDAHLGREKYQLQVMDWIIAGQPYKTITTGYTVGDKVKFYTEPDTQVLLATNINGYGRDAIKGLTGLIALGNAWESVDIFYALSQRLDYPGQAHIANLAKLRCAELIDHGEGMLMPGTPRGAELKAILRLNESFSHRADIDSDRKDYVYLRAEAEQWQRQRTNFMMARLLAGRHPDTDPTFWQGYHDTLPPKLAIPWDRRFILILRRMFGYQGAVIVPFITVVSTPFVLYYLFSRRKAKRAQKAKSF